MMTIFELLPKDKVDDSNLGKIKELSDAEIEPIIPELLGWLQDMNWPIANEIAEILRHHEDVVFPHIPGILQSDDAMWKLWVMEGLVPHFRLEHKQMLKQDIAALITEETTDEDVIAVSECAKKCLANC